MFVKVSLVEDQHYGKYNSSTLRKVAADIATKLYQNEFHGNPEYIKITSESFDDPIVSYMICLSDVYRYLVTININTFDIFAEHLVKYRTSLCT